MSVKFLAQHPTLGISCIDQAKQFYGDTLGFHLEFVWGEPNFYMGFSANGLEFHLSTHHLGVGTGTLYFEVDDVQTFYDAVVSRGGVPSSAPTNQPYGMKDFDIKDADGNTIGFGQRVGETPGN